MGKDRLCYLLVSRRLIAAGPHNGHWNSIIVAELRGANAGAKGKMHGCFRWRRSQMTAVTMEVCPSDDGWSVTTINRPRIAVWSADVSATMHDVRRGVAANFKYAPPVQYVTQGSHSIQLAVGVYANERTPVPMTCYSWPPVTTARKRTMGYFY